MAESSSATTTHAAAAAADTSAAAAAADTAAAATTATAAAAATAPPELPAVVGAGTTWRRVEAGGHGGAVSTVAFAPSAAGDGGDDVLRLVTACEDGRLREFSLRPTAAAPVVAPTRCLPASTTGLTCMAAAADGSWLLGTAAGKVIAAVQPTPPTAPLNLCMEEVAAVATARAAHGTTLALALDDDGHAYVFDAALCPPARPLAVHRRAHDVLGSAVAFLPPPPPPAGTAAGATHWAVTGGFDQRLRLWAVTATVGPRAAASTGTAAADDDDDVVGSIVAGGGGGGGKRRAGKGGGKKKGGSGGTAPAPAAADPPPAAAAAAGDAPSLFAITAATLTPLCSWGPDDDVATPSSAPTTATAGSSRHRGTARGGVGAPATSAALLAPPPLPTTEAADAPASDGKILNPAFVYAVAGHPTAAGVFAAAFGNGTVAVYLYDGGAGRLLWRVAAHSRAATCLAFAPDASALLSAGDDGRVAVWPLAPGGGLQTAALPPPTTEPGSVRPPAAVIVHGRGPNALAACVMRADGGLAVAIGDVTKRVAVYLLPAAWGGLGLGFGSS